MVANSVATTIIIITAPNNMITTVATQELPTPTPYPRIPKHSMVDKNSDSFHLIPSCYIEAMWCYMNLHSVHEAESKHVKR